MKSVRFVINGIITTGVHLAVMTAALWAGVSPVPATTAGYLAAVSYSYVTNYLFVFRSTERHVAALPKFLIISLSGFVVNVSITYVITEVLRIATFYAMVLPVLIVPPLSYILNDRWAFLTHQKEKPESHGAN